MTNSFVWSVATGLLTMLGGGVPALATETIGVTSQPLRSPLPERVTGFQANPHFLLLIGLPNEGKHNCDDDEMGKQHKCEAYDIFETINTFAPAVLGKASQSGWHDHPIPVGFVQVIQGTLWSQDASTPGCLKKYVTGSVVIERRGDIHNAFNFDSVLPAVIRSFFFIAHSEPLTRTDRPDPITGDPNVASAPPTATCPQ